MLNIKKVEFKIKSIDIKISDRGIFIYIISAIYFSITKLCGNELNKETTSNDIKM